MLFGVDNTRTTSMGMSTRCGCMCAHCLILTARIKRAKDSGPRCLGKHSLKGPAKCITSPGFSSLYRPRNWRHKLQQILIFIMQTLLKLHYFCVHARQTNFPHFTYVASSSVPLIALINHWKIGFSYVLHCLPLYLSLSLSVFPHLFRSQFMQFPIPTVALWRQKSIGAPPSNSSRPSFDKHKHKLNQYPWIGQ